MALGWQTQGDEEQDKEDKKDDSLSWLSEMKLALDLSRRWDLVISPNRPFLGILLVLSPLRKTAGRSFIFLPPKPSFLKVPLRDWPQANLSAQLVTSDAQHIMTGFLPSA
ncbi:hypothetical protein [uncultured Cohaesibacter sp.]|uniref:hypothetical protein n=1 Tax=uncultured Cohaesibacter sp. TaxID=1002546 RepID=UPI0029C85294|nr:hypothetical protein [uncultured Cohaesibacter sp.]